MTKQDIKLVQRVLKAVKADHDFWRTYVHAVKAAEGLDTDFPEKDFDGPVGRLHMLNARMQEAGIKQEPKLVKDFSLLRDFLYLAFETASSVGENE